MEHVSFQELPLPKIDTQKQASKILRFKRSERHLHWALAIPFLICLTTAIILILVYNPAPGRPYRSYFSWAHRISGLALFLLPLLAIYKSRHDFKVFYYNIKQAWVWTFEDIKWLSLMGLAAIFSRIKLPEQGKFNAAEKINFMNLMVTYPLYIITGLTVWMTDNAFAAWLIHCMMAAMAMPLLSGHIFMATINPASRVGLPGMIHGWVDRHWARHHYTKWYREHYENQPVVQPVRIDVS